MCSRLATLIMAAFTGVLYVTNAQQTRQCFDHESACVDDKPMFRDSRPCKSLCAQRATERRVTNSAHECGEEKNQCCCYFNPVAKQQQRRENNNKQDDADTAESSDLITGLPGLNFKPNFKQYSGHLDGDNNGTIKLFYWYAQSQNDSKNDPIIFWYNGGPGCSSMEGFLTENGPFHINKKGDELVQNPYSWNQLANLVAIDQPAGTGFSYTTDGKTAFSDETAAQANAHALNEFFKRYPDLIHNDFYLSGESYAGIYIPTTARRIIEAIKAGSFANKNFKGIMMGNGAYDMNVHTSTMVPYLYYHGVLGYELVAAFTKITSVCCGGNMTDGFCDYAKHVVPDIAANFVSDGSECGELVIQAAYDITFNDIQNQYNAYQNRPDLFSNDAEGGYECYAENSYVKYLNLPEVQTALHIPDDFKSIIGEYQMCSDPVFYDYKQQYVDISEVFKWLLTEQDVPIKILSYHGDADTVCNFIGATVFIHRLVESMSLKPTAARKAWRYLGAIGGFVEEYGERLTFLTVHGAGHMVPTDRPGPALQMITDFILGNSMNKQILRRQ